MPRPCGNNADTGGCAPARHVEVDQRPKSVRSPDVPRESDRRPRVGARSDRQLRGRDASDLLDSMALRPSLGATRARDQDDVPFAKSGQVLVGIGTLEIVESYLIDIAGDVPSRLARSHSVDIEVT